MGPVSLPSNYIITGLINETQYSVIIRAINSVGTGDFSSAVVGTPVSGDSMSVITQPIEILE